MRGTKRVGNGSVQPVGGNGRVSRQMPVRVLPGHTERRRPVLFRVFGRSHLLLVVAVADHRAGTRAARHGPGLGESDRGHRSRRSLGERGEPAENDESQ